MTRHSEKKKEWLAMLGALEIGDIDLANKICEENQFDLDDSCTLAEKERMKRRGNNVKIEGINGVTIVVEDFRQAGILLHRNHNYIHDCCFTSGTYCGAKLSYVREPITDLSNISEEQIRGLIKQKTMPTGVKIKVILEDGESKIFKTVSDAARFLKMTQRTVKKYAEIKQPYKGYLFEYVDEVTE